MKHGLAGIGAYWCIVEMIYEEKGYLLLTEYERITFELRTDENVIRYIIFDSELFKNDKEKFWSETALQRLKKRTEKSEKARQSIENRWNKNSKYTNEIRTYNDGNTIKVNKSKVNIKLIPPSFDEVKKYCQERKNRVDPGAFIDFYSAKGWKIGNTTMKDWQAAVRTWENRDKKTAQPQKISAGW
jgi:hypothetical protein